MTKSEATGLDVLTEDLLADHERRLLGIAASVFYGDTGAQLELDPTTSKIHVGFYLAARRFPAKQREHRPHRDAKLAIKMRYLLSVDAQPLTVTAGVAHAISCRVKAAEMACMCGVPSRMLPLSSSTARSC